MHRGALKREHDVIAALDLPDTVIDLLLWHGQTLHRAMKAIQIVCDGLI